MRLFIDFADPDWQRDLERHLSGEPDDSRCATGLRRARGMGPIAEADDRSGGSSRCDLLPEMRK